MKVGLVLECTAQGPDAMVYPYVMSRLCPGLKIQKPVTTGNKAALMEECGIHSDILLKDGCDCVFIIWDRMPKWGGTGKCDEHRAGAFLKLDEVKVDKEKVFLICISDMMESWMIADGRGITKYFQSFTTHQLQSFGDHKDPASQTSPKDRIAKYNGRYNDYTDNFKIVQQFDDFERAAKWNDSFGELKINVEKICPK